MGSIGKYLNFTDKHIQNPVNNANNVTSTPNINLTMFSAAVRNQFRRATVQTVRSASSSSHPKPLIPASILSRWYATFGKSNAAYLSWIVMGVLIGEAVTGVATDALWNSINYGKTYDTVDWSKFVVADDEDEEEEEEEEEDGGDEEDGDDDDE